MRTGILPRSCKIRLDGSLRKAQCGGNAAEVPPIPHDVLAHIAGPITVSQPQQGVSSTVRFLHSPQQDYVLKSTRDPYRNSELQAEYAALLHFRHRNNARIPVPYPCLFLRKDNWHHMLTARCEGLPLCQVMQSADGHERTAMIEQIAQTLQAIHANKVDMDWCHCLASQLWFAQQHLGSGSLDPTEFIVDRTAIDPAALLRRLRTLPPQPGAVCVLHGDYRPKNLLWHSAIQRISAVLDWAFCDIGDPYYDLAIILYYMRDQQERARFLASYGLPVPDEDRLRYFTDLSKFINV